MTKRRDHSNPAARISWCRNMGPRIRMRKASPMPLPIRHNICPECGHSNVDLEKVSACRMCGTAIKASAFRDFDAGDPAAWRSGT